MDVAGQGASTRPDGENQLGSDDLSGGKKCAQCLEDSKLVDASGFCFQCGDYLCDTCIKQHKKLRGLKEHGLLEGTDMPSHKPNLPAATTCQYHLDEPIQVYCHSHEQVGCVLCLKEEHFPCSNIGVISYLTKEIDMSEDVKDTKKATQQCERLIHLYRKRIQGWRSVNDRCYDKTIEDFESFRKEMAEMQDKLGESIKAEAEALRKRNECKLDMISERVSSLGEESKTLISEIELNDRTKQRDQLFISLKKNRPQMMETAERLDQLSTEIQIPTYTFEAEETLKKVIESNTCFGKIMMSPDYSGNTLGEIDMKTAEDKNACVTHAIVEISPTELVVTDYENQCVKKLDVSSCKLIQRLPLISGPYDIAVIPGSRVVVTMPDLHQLQFISTYPCLVQCDSIALDDQCLAIACSGDKLFVSFIIPEKPGKIEILDLEGKRLQSFSRDAEGSRLFDTPSFVGIGLDHNSIFISESSRRNVTCLSDNGSILWRYTDKELKFPVGVDIDANGYIFICCSDTNTVHILSAEGERQNVISLTEFKLEEPDAICISKFHGLLYLSSSSKDPQQCNMIRRLPIPT